MSNQMEYKCPACGGALAFDSASQKLKCPFCDSVYNLDQFEQQQPGPAQQAQAQQGEQPATGGMNWNVEPGSEWAAGETDDISVLSCNSWVVERSYAKIRPLQQPALTAAIR